MKQMITAVLGMMVICVSGCARTLPPHEELNQAVKKSLDATGYNYSSKSRVTNLSLPQRAANGASGGKGLQRDKGLQYLGAGLDIVRGFSVNIDGAVDMKGKKSEAVYDLHYNKDNVDVSIKMPLFVDNNTQTIYVGTSFLNTVLDVVSPHVPETKGKLLKISISELLKESTSATPALSKLIDGNRFNAKNMDLIDNIFKAGILKAVAGLNDSCFIDQPLTEQDKTSGVERRIMVTLGQSDSVAVILEVMDSVAQALSQEGVIDKKEYDVLHSLTDRQVLDKFMNKFTLTMTNDVGVAQSGHVRYVVTRLSVADKEGNYQVGVENVSSFDGYDTPHFSITPEAGQTVDFKEVLAAITAVRAKDKKASPPDAGTPDQTK